MPMIRLEKKKTRTVRPHIMQLTDEQWTFICTLAETGDCGKSDSVRYLLDLGIYAHTHTTPQGGDSPHA